MVVCYNLSGGGAERFSSTLLSALPPRAFQLHLVLLRDEISYPLPRGITVSIASKYRTRDLPGAIVRLRKIISRCRPAVILSTTAFTSRMVGLALCGLRLRPRWIVRLSTDPIRYGRGLNHLLDRYFLRQCDRVVASSPAQLAQCRSVFGLPAARLCWIHNPMNLEELERLSSESLPAGAPGRKHVVLYVGRLENIKEPWVALRAFARLHGHCDAELWFCGEGSLAGSLERQAAALGIAEIVRFCGWQENPFAFMKQASVLLLSSRHEGLPNALIEAQCLGLPVVATRCAAGIETIVEDGVSGFLADVGDDTGLSSALRKVLTDEALRSRMSNAARRRAIGMFSLNERIAEWERVLR